jgi:hypothetical protein
LYLKKGNLMKRPTTVILSMPPERAGQSSSAKRTALKSATLTLVFTLSSYATGLFQENFSGAVPTAATVSGRYRAPSLP